MWLPDNIVADVKRVARVFYINVDDTRLWNKHKRDGELRLLTGWCWTSRSGGHYRHGFKSITVAYRDAWYVLVQHTEAPPVGHGTGQRPRRPTGRPRLRVVASNQGRA